MCCADPVQPLTSAAEELNGLDDVADLECLDRDLKYVRHDIDYLKYQVFRLWSRWCRWSIIEYLDHDLNYLHHGLDYLEHLDYDLNDVDDLEYLDHDLKYLHRDLDYLKYLDCDLDYPQYLDHDLSEAWLVFRSHRRADRWQSNQRPWHERRPNHVKHVRARRVDREMHTVYFSVTANYSTYQITA